MEKSVEKRMLKSIAARGSAWAFSSKDFTHLGTRSAVDLALHRLEDKGTIRRVLRGIYDLPRFSSLLGQDLSPDLDAVANAIARKFGWRIQVNGPSALSLMGLSQQVPSRILYSSDGPNREFEVTRSTITFKHTPLKDSGFKVRESSLIVQGLKSLGEERVTPESIAAVRRWLDPRLRKKVLRDTKAVTGWVQAAIMKICREDD